MSNPTPNTDEMPIAGSIPYIGNFHKTLPHNEYGEVDAAAYREFRLTCLAVEAGATIDFEAIARGVARHPFEPGANASAARFTSPLAGASSEILGPDPKSLEMSPAPSIYSIDTAAEMVELYWMALLRDVPLDQFATNQNVLTAVAEVKAAYANAIAAPNVAGSLELVKDLPAANGSLDIKLQTLFRCGLKDEEHGPLISQFFLQDIPYGVQTISTDQIPYTADRDYLTNYEDWLRAQDTGKDKYGRDYGNCNFYFDDPRYYNVNNPRKISTMRDLARFVNRDALHQAYFNAALLLDAVGAPLDAGNPYRSRYTREGGFATLGGPDLLTLVSEVASRALKVVWRQKWLVHRRCRPEVYAGLLQMQLEGIPGVNGTKRAYGIPNLAAVSAAGQRIWDANKKTNDGQGTRFLPMAFSAGSPSHPAYGAGHATVAGACVTVLKAWFDENVRLVDIGAIANEKANRKEPGVDRHLLRPGKSIGLDNFDPPTIIGPQDSDFADAERMTVGGELNKAASNVAMGRTMGGVHWRSDNTRSLRLGEKIAIEILRKRTLEYF